MADRLAAVAGEASGDLIGAQVVSRLLQKMPALQVGGIGGDQLRAAGMQCWFQASELAVRGYLEALSKLPRILWVRHKLLQQLQRWRPQVYLGIDAPDFNLGVEARLKARGVRTIHFISPAIWAWRPERLARIEDAVDHMLCVFPFEPECYRGSRVRATYVGHPLADVIPVSPNATAAREALGLGGISRPIVAVLPGSRLSEIQLNGPSFLAAAVLLAHDCQVIVPVASAAMGQALRSLPLYARAQQAGIVFLESTRTALPISHTALAACDVVLVASGTATLEAALFKRPMVIAYKVPAFSYRLMARKALVTHIGLPNILLGERVVPELIQEAVTPVALASAIRDWLDQPSRVASLAERFHSLHRTLSCHAAEQVADLVSAEFQASGQLCASAEDPR